MSKRRDQLIAVSAVAVVVLLLIFVVTAVLTAERNGRQALEELQLAQVEQLARVLDGAVGPALASQGGLTNPSTHAPWTLVPGDASDRAGLEVLQNAQTSARTGMVLIDARSVLTNGTLLLDPTSVGQRIDRPGLQGVLQGTAAVLPVAQHSLTTPLPSIAFARPIRMGENGPVVGALVQESDVAPDSSFTTTIANFRRGRTDEYSFLDANAIVVASTNPAIVGKTADPSLIDPARGFHRHGSVVTATANIPSIGWTAAFRQSTSEFEGDLTGPLRSALLLLIVITALGGGLTFFVLVSRLRAARREQQRLADINRAREEFISIVSHELRTPATGQLGFLQTLLDHWDDLNESDRRRTVSQAYANARRLHALSRDVLDTSSIEAGELPYAFETVELRSAIDNAIHALPLDDHEVVVSADEEVAVRADPERIQQVLTNLLDNAVKSAPIRSRIDVRVTTSGDDALVSVSDRGPGLTDGELDRIFEKFSRGRHAGVTGTGLGLFICRMIVVAHHGRIWAERRSGGGTTVSFTLPLVEQPGAPQQSAASTVPAVGEQ